jgi:hypothetical protein
VLPADAVVPKAVLAIQVANPASGLQKFEKKSVDKP